MARFGLGSGPEPGGVGRQVRVLFGSGSVAGLDDAELLARFLAGRDDGASFEALVARHGPMVARVCRDILGDTHAADDAFQATFLVLVRRAPSVRVGDSLGRWLHGVACRVARRARADLAKRLRREGLSSLPPGDEPIARQESASAVLERADARAVLHEELDRLPGPYRSALVLCHLEGLSHDEAAERLSWPVGTVRSRLARGRDRLRGRLVRRGIAPAAALAALGVNGRAALPSTLALAARASANLGIPGVGISPTAWTLARGVMLSMTLAPIKIASGFLGAGLIVATTAGLATTTQAPADSPGKPVVAAASTETPSATDEARSQDTEVAHKQRILLELEKAIVDLKAGRSNASLVHKLQRVIDMANQLEQPAVVASESPQPTPVPLPTPSPAATPPTRAARTDPFDSLPSPASSPTSAKLGRTAPTVPAILPPASADLDINVVQSPSVDDVSSRSGVSPRALLAAYAAAKASREWAAAQYKNGYLSSTQLGASLERVQTLRGQIDDTLQRWKDELELLDARMARAKAAVERARAQREVAASTLAQQERINTRIKGGVSDEELAKTRAEAYIAASEVDMSQAGVREIEILMRQTRNRIQVIERALAESDKPENPARRR